MRMKLDLLTSQQGCSDILTLRFLISFLMFLKLGQSAHFKKNSTTLNLNQNANQKNGICVFNGCILFFSFNLLLNFSEIPQHILLLF